MGNLCGGGVKEEEKPSPEQNQELHASSKPRALRVCEILVLACNSIIFDDGLRFQASINERARSSISKTPAFGIQIINKSQQAIQVDNLKD